MFKFLEEFYKEQIAEVTKYFPRAQMITINDKQFGAYDSTTSMCIGFNNETGLWGLMIDHGSPQAGKSLSELVPR